MVLIQSALKQGADAPALIMIIIPPNNGGSWASPAGALPWPCASTK